MVGDAGLEVGPTSQGQLPEPPTANTSPSYDPSPDSTAVGDAGTGDKSPPSSTSLSHPKPRQSPRGIARNDTPLRMEAAGLIMHDHTLDSIRGYVIQDLADAVSATVEDWAELYLGLDHETFERWSTKIAKERWFEEPAMQTALEQYCRAKTEVARYKPFITLVTLLMEKARTTLNLHGAGNTFPITDIGLFQGADRPIEPIREHGALGAERKPDIILMRKAAMPATDTETKVQWSDVLSWFELKYEVHLLGELNHARKARNLSPLPTGEEDTVSLVASEPNTPETANAVVSATGPVVSTQTTEPVIYTEPTDADAVGSVAADKGSGLASASSSGIPVAHGTKRRRDTRPVDDCLRHMKARLANGTFQLDPTDPSSTVNLSGGVGALQSGSYALELLSCTYGSRVSCFGVIVKDDHLYLWYYDACGIAYTDRRLSLVSDFEDAAAILIAIADCTAERFGAFPSAAMEPANPYPAHFPPRNLSGNAFDVTSVCDKQALRVTLKNPVSTRYSITGRRSFIYTADVGPSLRAVKDGRVIVKFSYQVSTRTAEQKLVAHAQKCGVEHLPGLHASEDLWTLKDRTREISYKQKKRATKAGKRDIINKLKRETNVQGFLEYEDRVLRAIVYTEYGSIWTLFSEHFELIPIMVDQMLDCLHDLYYKAKILHRDVSINNIMYQIRNGTYYFVLIDFDMAVNLDDAIRADGSYKASSKNRTGTLPFMAHELVRDAAKAWHNASDWVPVRHLLRHEYESLFYVSFWSVTALVYPKGTDPLHRFLYEGAKRLENGTLLALATQKEGICRKPLDDNLIVLQGPTTILENWFTAWSQLFTTVSPLIDAHRNQLKLKKSNPAVTVAPFDLETLNGIFTRDNIKAALTPYIPDLSWKTARARKPPSDAPPIDTPGTSLTETFAPLKTPGTTRATRKAKPTKRVTKATKSSTSKSRRKRKA